MVLLKRILPRHQMMVSFLVYYILRFFMRGHFTKYCMIKKLQIFADSVLHKQCNSFHSRGYRTQNLTEAPFFDFLSQVSSKQQLNSCICVNFAFQNLVTSYIECPRVNVPDFKGRFFIFWVNIILLCSINFFLKTLFFDATAHQS